MPPAIKTMKETWRLRVWKTSGLRMLMPFPALTLRRIERNADDECHRSKMAKAAPNAMMEPR